MDKINLKPLTMEQLYNFTYHDINVQISNIEIISDKPIPQDSNKFFKTIFDNIRKTEKFTSVELDQIMDIIDKTPFTFLSMIVKIAFNKDSYWNKAEYFLKQINRSQSILLEIIGDHFIEEQKIMFFTTAVVTDNPLLSKINGNVNFIICIFDNQMTLLSVDGEVEIDDGFFDTLANELFIDDISIAQIIDLKDLNTTKEQGWKTLRREEINESYIFLRKNNQTIPSDTLEWIKDAALFQLKRSYLIDEDAPLILEEDLLNILNNRISRIEKIIISDGIPNHLLSASIMARENLIVAKNLVWN
jgi:hypothetical protein